MANAFERREKFGIEMAKLMREKKVVPWQQENIPIPLPKSATSDRQYNGLNAMYLMVASAQKGYSDPRWVTVNAANEHNHHVKKDEHGVALEFWRENKEGKMEVVTYSVFNMEQLNTHFPLPPRQLEADYETANVMLERAGVDIPPDSPQEVYQAAFKKLATKTLEEAGYAKDVHTPELMELRANIAYTLLMHKCHIPVAQDKEAPVQSWAFSISHDPRQLYEAIRDAGNVVNVMLQEMQRTRTPEEIMRFAEKHIEMSKSRELEAEAQQQRAEAQRASEIIDGAAAIPKGMDSNLPGVDLNPAQENIHASIDKATSEIHEMHAAAGAKERTAGKVRFADAVDVAKGLMGEGAIISNAQPGKPYTGQIVGLVGKEPDLIAIQRISGNQAVLHKIKEVAAEANIEVGAEVTITKGSDGQSVVREPGEIAQAVEREERQA